MKKAKGTESSRAQCWNYLQVSSPPRPTGSVMMTQPSLKEPEILGPFLMPPLH